jgi:hypothetical protein
LDDTSGGKAAQKDVKNPNFGIRVMRRLLNKDKPAELVRMIGAILESRNCEMLIMMLPKAC